MLSLGLRTVDDFESRRLYEYPSWETDLPPWPLTLLRGADSRLYLLTVFVSFNAREATVIVLSIRQLIEVPTLSADEVFQVVKLETLQC